MERNTPRPQPLEQSVQTEILSRAIHYIRECIVITDLSGNIVYVNEAFENTYGYASGELLGQTVALILSEKNPPNVDAIYQHTLQGGWQGRILNRRKDGNEFPAHFCTSVIYDAAGKALALMAVTRDVTRQESAEESLRQAERQIQAMQKIEAIGRLAGGIAHDFNNMLTVINGYAQMILENNDIPPKHRAYLEQILESGEKAERMTKQLLAFGRRQHMKPVVLNINDVISEMSRLLKRVIGEDIELQTHLDAQLGQVKVDQSQLEQIIMNLAINARDAMPRGGMLTIETANVHLDENYDHSHIAVIQTGDYVMFAVTDNGIGMDPETQARIFEPFFTTKEKGKGTGLGLATVYGIVKQSNGYIWVYSEKGVGTTFKIYFPLVNEPVEKPPSPKPVRAPRLKGHERILLVEDEEAVRRIVEKTLKKYGYKVTATSDGAEAMALCSGKGRTYDLLITDIVMPKIGGVELAKELQPRFPEMKVLYMSGYTDTTIVQHGILATEAAYIQKPFSMNYLASRVRDILDSRK